MHRTVTDAVRCNAHCLIPISICTRCVKLMYIGVQMPLRVSFVGNYRTNLDGIRFLDLVSMEIDV